VGPATTACPGLISQGGNRMGRMGRMFEGMHGDILPILPILFLNLRSV
jgi:hypothetical protein